MDLTGAKLVFHRDDMTVHIKDKYIIESNHRLPEYRRTIVWLLVSTEDKYTTFICVENRQESKVKTNSDIVHSILKGLEEVELEKAMHETLEQI